jgi:hypothetical protein
MTCPACQEKRRHTAEDWQHHPLAGNGFTVETGWTFDAKEALRAELLNAAAPEQEPGS